VSKRRVIISELFHVADLRDVARPSVLDMGTSNGAAAFLLERAGARFVVAIDVYAEDWSGFGPIRDFPGSEVEYIQGTVYEVGRLLGRPRFDLVLLWGVLYHLRQRRSRWTKCDRR
jgi:2-polyprenyl-3-methyl-5-hydroxy-6-metoxy-1,4-benzoquinol methylase